MRVLRMEHKTAVKTLQGKDSEILALQGKYEEILESKESELTQLQLAGKAVEDKLRFEIEYLRK